MVGKTLTLRFFFVYVHDAVVRVRLQSSGCWMRRGFSQRSDPSLLLTDRYSLTRDIAVYV